MIFAGARQECQGERGGDAGPTTTGVLPSRGSRREALCTRPVPLGTMRRYGRENNPGRADLRQVLALALLVGLLGGVALGAVAGARRTSAAYGRYLAAINASDVFVNVPGQLPGMPTMRPYELISALPGVVGHAAYIGLSGVPL